MSTSVLSCATALCCVLLAPAHATRDQAPVGAPEVGVQLVSNVAMIGAGEDFEVAVVFEIPEGCHIYWSNPGDVGMATQAKLKGPAGFVIEGPLFPGPREFMTGNGMRCFGYSDDFVLFFKVKAPRGATSGNARFSARVDWLVSRESDFLGKAEPTLSLPLGSKSSMAGGSSSHVLDSQRQLLPRRWKDIERQTELSWELASEDTGEGAQIALQIALREAERLTFFPSLESEMILLGQEFEHKDKRAHLALVFEWLSDGSSKLPRARGVLRVERGLDLSYFEVDARGRLPGRND